MGQPAATPTPRSQQNPPAAAATPPSTGGHDQHQGHQLPTPTPAPSSTPAPTPQPMPQPAQTIDHSGHQMSPPQPQQAVRARRDGLPEGPVMRLEDLERMATENNPTLAQAEAAIRAALGRGRQAGLFPNPVVGYSGGELNFRAPSERGEHGFFVEQKIPLGGKLGKAKRVFAREAEQSEATAQAQRQRVLNSVRVLYFDALGAQRLVELRGDLSRLAREAVEITKELYNVGQADRPDQLEIEIEAERAEIELLRARTDREQVWRLLGAMVGNPQLQPARLAGSLEEESNALDQEQVLGTLLRDSPELKAAQAGVERARAVLERARAERTPDLFVRGGVAYNKERLESDNRRAGAEGNIEVGISVPIFNRNQGGIAAAEAELAIAEREQQRLQLVLRTRLASSFRDYRNAQQTVEKYRLQVIPRARQAYEMYLSNFRQMAASYPQVLIAQRTLFQVEVEYARAILELRQSAVGLRGFLLSGGLEAVGMTGESGRGGTEGFTLRGANDAAGDSDNR
ncbi:MAG: TolC family protein [Acidobacteria bacterium]|nr:TolC family protein [Acidobacteriota bacterium]